MPGPKAALRPLTPGRIRVIIGSMLEPPDYPPIPGSLDPRDYSGVSYTVINSLGIEGDAGVIFNPSRSLPPVQNGPGDFNGPPRSQ